MSKSGLVRGYEVEVTMSYQGYRNQWLVDINGGWMCAANTYKYFNDKDDATAYYNKIQEA